MKNKKKQLWWPFTILMIACLYWLSNVVLWIPWSRSPELGMILMLTVNPVFWGVGIYSCLACTGGVDNWLKKALIVSLIAVGISLLSDYLFFAVLMKSKDVWHITTFYGYAWLVILSFAEALLFRKRLERRQFAATSNLLLMLISGLLVLSIILVCLI